MIMFEGILEPYVLRVTAELQLLSSMKYFQPAVAVAVLLVSFLLGRKTYESKFTTVLNTINDSENEKRRLKTISEQKKASLREIVLRQTFFKMATVAVVLAAAAYTYLRKFDPLVIVAAAVTLSAFWTILLIWKKYLQTTIKSTDDKLQKKLLSSENDAKEIIGLLGEDLCKQLKIKFEREMQVSARSEELKECELKKCLDEKSTYRELYLLYKEIIGEMQKTQWCEICAQQLNTDANQIKLAQFELRLRQYRVASEKLSLDRKKELTNKLLEEWQILEGRLPFMCKRGCCVKFRQSLDATKKAYHDKLKTLKGRLALLK